MNVIFFGSSAYSLPVIQTLADKFDLTCVITKKGQAVEKFSSSHNIQTLTPDDRPQILSLKDRLKELKPDLAVVADYGLIIPSEIFSIPRFQTLNIHFSRLPKFRGPSPVQATILAGGKSAWISAILMDKEMDTGDIIWQKEITSVNISTETAESLYTKLFNIVSSELPGIIKKYINKEIKPQKQDHSAATYTKHLARQDGYIPWQTLAAALNKGVESETFERKIRAFTPWPGVWTEVTIGNSKKRLKILKSHLENGKLILDEVQLEGKNPVTWKQFLEGHKITTESS